MVCKWDERELFGGVEVRIQAVRSYDSSSCQCFFFVLRNCLILEKAMFLVISATYLRKHKVIDEETYSFVCIFGLGEIIFEMVIIGAILGS